MSSAKTADRRKLRRFGLTVAIGFTTLATISWWRGHTVAPTVMWSLAAVLLAPAIVAPMALAPVERAWMTLGGWLAWFNTRVILTVLFYVVVTPVGLIVRMFRDPLDRQLSEAGTSYWIRRNVQPFKAENYQRQF
jgi:hypothetical protein